jgi:hypothetical protein
MCHAYRADAASTTNTAVSMSKDGRPAIVRLEQLQRWQHNKPDDQASGAPFDGVSRPTAGLPHKAAAILRPRNPRGLTPNHPAVTKLCEISAIPGAQNPRDRTAENGVIAADRPIPHGRTANQLLTFRPCTRKLPGTRKIEQSNRTAS